MDDEKDLKILPRNSLQKLVAARIRIKSLIKKTGFNQTEKYSTYQLSDILPHVNKLAGELGFVCQYNVYSERAELRFINVDRPDVDVLVFEIPTAKTGVQNSSDTKTLITAVDAIRLHLYMRCFEIAQEDKTGENYLRKCSKLMSAIEIIINQRGIFTPVETMRYKAEMEEAKKDDKVLLQIYTRVKMEEAQKKGANNDVDK